MCPSGSNGPDLFDLYDAKIYLCSMQNILELYLPNSLIYCHESSLILMARISLRLFGISTIILRANLPDLTVWKDPDSSEWIFLVDCEIFSGLLPFEEFPLAIYSGIFSPKKFSTSQNIFSTHSQKLTLCTTCNMFLSLNPFCGKLCTPCNSSYTLNCSS